MKRIFYFAAVAIAAIAASEQASRAGSVVRFFYEGDSLSSNPTAYRQSVSTLTSWIYFPNSPSYREQLDDFFAMSGQPLNAGFQGKDNSGQDYGSWTRGYLEAPATGIYFFGLASGDNSEFWLSTNHLAANKALIAYEPGTGESLFSGNRLETRVSAGINLVKGQKYYFEALHQHGGGAGYIQVGWQRPDGVQEIIPALHLAQYEDESVMDTYGGFVNFAGSAPAFNNPANTGSLRGGYLGGDLTNAVTIKEGEELLLPLDIIAPQPTTYVWRTNGVIVPGETLSFFRLTRTPASYNGVQIRAVVSNAYGSLTSAVATVTVTPDVVPPTILTVDTAGNPNLVQIIYSEPVSPVTATNLVNYSVTNLSGGLLTITDATLSANQLTVFLSGNFNFSATTNYLLRVQNVKDQATAGNTISPNPSSVAFTLSAPLGTTYTFESGLPSNFRAFGNAAVTNSILAPSGSGVLRLTDAARNLNGHALLTDRRDIDQVHVRFKIRVSDAGASVFTDQPWGDGFSVNISAGLPLGTFGSPQFGYSPAVAANQLSVFFNGHENSVLQPVSVGVSLNSSVITNILAGTNGIPFNGIPSINSTDGHWALVDLNIQRDGTLDLAYDGVTLLTNYQTAWVGINSAQVGLAAGTRNWYQTHWVDDLYVNFGEGDVGNVGLAASSILGGSFAENSTVRLVAVPTGAGPFSYQWYKNGAPVSGATNRILTFTGVSGSGGNFRLALSNAFSGVISSTNAVVIVPDLIPPAVVSARGVAGGVNQVILTFNEPLDPVTASTPATYSSAFFIVSGVALSADGRTVTLTTTQQRVGTTYSLSISGLKDAATAGNALSTSLNFLSNLTYRDEILADIPSRYLKLDETSGTVAFTENVLSDASNTNGTYNNLPVQGVPPLVPSANTNEFAVRLIEANSNNIVIPNGGDVNDFRGPWAKKSYELWFKADSLPIGWQPGDTAILGQTHAISGLWEEGGNLRSIGLYLWNNVTNAVANTNSPGTALLAFHSYNSTADGPGSPYGLLNNPATYVTYPITTNVIYHVVAVQDGDTGGTNGGLRLYINSALVAQLTNGVGQIYNHNGDVQIGRGNARSHLNASGNWGYFNGTIDEVSTFNSVLSSNRILAHYRAGLGLSTVPTIDPTLVSSVDPRGNPNRLSVTFNQPVSAATATTLANYVLKTSGNVTLPITSAQLGSDLKTVSLNGSFNFAIGSSYNITVANVADILAATNKVATTNLAFTFTSAGPVAISGASDLGNKSVTENQTVQWTVVATGQTPYTYQWRSNNVALAGQTNATLSFIAKLNSAANYSVVVSNEFSSVTSAPPAVLTVLPDLLPPQLVGVQALAGTINEIRLTFNEAVDPVTGTNLATYGIPTSGSTGLALLSAAISADGLQVTLKTTTQVHGQTNQITITNLRDRANTPNTHTATAQFVSGISYRNEILAEGAVRYWTFDEASGTAFNSLVSKFDTDPLNVIGTIFGNPTLGVPGLVPNAGGSAAILFNKLNPNHAVNLPNSKDLNAILGPWSKVTHTFSFKAQSLPRAFGATNSEAPAIYGHNSLVIYLQGTQDTNNPTQAQLVFKAQNTASEGPGSPWGGNTLATAKYITYPISAGVTYNVVAVLDGNASFTGQLRLYINGTLVGTATGIGQIYKHPNSPPAFAHSYFTSVNGTNYTIRPDLVTYPSGTAHWGDVFDGVIDEFSIINGVLSPARIAQLNTFAQTSPAASGFSIVTPTAIAPSLSIASSGVNNITVGWPAAGSSGYYLEYATNLASGLWFSNPATPIVLSGTNTVTQTISNGSRFFRLHKP